MADPSKIDVLHLIGTLSAGGAERNLYYLAPCMAASKLRYGICCLFGRGDLADEVEEAGVPVWEITFRRRYTFSSIWKLAGLLRRKKIKVIHTHLFVPGLVGRLAGLIAGTRVMITHEHGKTLWKKWYHRLAERMLLPVTDLRIVVSRDILALRAEREHTPLNKLRLVPNAVDPARFDVAPASRAGARQSLGIGYAFVVGTVGRLVQAKGFDLLIEVARRVCAVRPDTRFVIVGEGPLGESLRGLADSSGLSGCVIFTGRRQDIPEVLAAMDLYISTSWQEGLPLSLIEAMMAGKAIVAPAVGGIPEAISDNQEGVLVESRDGAALAKAVLALAGDPERRERLGAAARQRAVERYSPCRVLEELEVIYGNLLHRE
jgi:glycosyltransferase involved in cell wall biosynthesis